MVKVSVAMITYNHEDYIRDALDGILMQKTNFDFNIVIGEDSSSDNTKSILKEYIKEYPNRITCTFYEKNIGMMPNFISTLESCTGEYIALCEGDDYWVDDYKLQKQVDFLDDSTDFVGCFHNVILKNETNLKIKPKPWRTYSKDIFNLLDTFSKTALFHTCSFVFKKEALQIPEWFKNVRSGDMALFSIIASHGKLKLIEGEMGVYRKNEGGVTSSLEQREYHNNRVDLIHFFKNHFKVHYDRLNEIEAFHKNELQKLKYSKIKNIVKRVINKK